MATTAARLLQASTSRPGRPTSTRRPRRRRQRGQRQADRPQGRTEALPLAQRLRRRPARRARQDRAPEATRCGWSKKPCTACCRRRSSGSAMYRKLKVYARADHPHAAQKPQQARGRVTWLQRSITARAAARRPPLACSSAPARARSPSTSRPLEASFPTETLRLVDSAAAGRHRDRRAVRRAGDDRRRRRRPARPARCGSGIARALVELRRRAAVAAAQGRAADARPARQGTQEVRHGGARKRFQFSKR